MKSWKVTRQEGKIILKKRCDLLLLLALGILLPLPFLWKDIRAMGSLWYVYPFYLFANFAWFAPLFFGKIVLDTDQKEISIYNLCKETFRFEELREVNSRTEVSDGDGGGGISIVFLFQSGYKIELPMESQTQAQEWITFLRSILPTIP